MDLTPELFEKTEFTERRKGYDIEQVETFMEDAGTALAQLLVRVRHTEERAAVAESRLSEAESRAAAAEEKAGEVQARAQAAVAEAQASARSASAMSEEAEVEQAARTLLMARRTAEQMEADARGQAQNLLVEAKTRADRQLAEAQAEAEELIRRARTQADSEFADRRGRAMEEVQVLESRRSQLADVITQLEARLAGYREDLTRTAEELTLLASDPDRLGARPTMSIPPDEVIVQRPSEPLSVPEPADEPEPVRSSDSVVEVSSVEPDHDPVGPADDEPSTEAPSTGAPQAAAQERVVDFDKGAGDGPPTEAVDAADSDWGPGSWSRLETSGGVPPEETISLADEPSRQTAPHIIAEPVTGSGRDRYLQDLDDAVNVSDEDDEAMTAFFEGSGETRNRRFGWRR
ncbi:DivIVA domain-containing protein [Dermatobacter hominis]|uniref:DivIVA domain-containing protein n=1 Tax=Dermatobacter hominis TaxID=2884263 RepID=UPI001D1134EB|nr:DivIVA domain-containing protein [Dermatobacter hominis]UDY35985.1 DivIVA domain-containing protein [Dermatobacter hominis]